jgi:hypothetical protein
MPFGVPSADPDEKSDDPQREDNANPLPMIIIGILCHMVVPIHEIIVQEGILQKYCKRTAVFSGVCSFRF